MSSSSTPELWDRKKALFQARLSSDIPHSRAIGMELVDIGYGTASMRLQWREDLVGNPETGVLHGGVVTALLDSCCGAAVFGRMETPQTMATLDLRIDYVRPATPHEAVIADAECYRITRNIAFLRATAHHGDPSDPIATATGTFMLGTKGTPRVSKQEYGAPAAGGAA